MKVRFAAVAVLILLLVPPAADATKIEKCLTRDVDNGTLYCNKVCEATSSGSYCGAPEENAELAPGAYCWQGVLYGTSTTSCHEGSWDECCMTMGGF